MADITYVTGDATNPIGQGPKIIVNLCNDVGAWGRGFVLAISKRWPHVEQSYRRWFQDSPSTFKLGASRLVEVPHPGGLTWVANIIGQHGILIKNGNVPIRYDAVEESLESVARSGQFIHGSIHMPRIGCGLAGGTWAEIESIVRRTLVDNGLNVTVYDYVPSGPADRAYVPAQIAAASSDEMVHKVGALRHGA